MYAVIRSFPQMQNVEEAGRLAATGLARILKQQPGFSAFYLIRLEGGGRWLDQPLRQRRERQGGAPALPRVDQGQSREHDWKRPAGRGDG